jgi:hypothetical protein
MPIRRTEPTHDSPTQPRRSSPDIARAEAGPLHQPDPDDTNPAGDQDIDTAGTDADDESPTKGRV